MNFCQFIKVIANNTANKIPKEYVHQRLFLMTIGFMPLYLEMNALDLWEQDCQQVPLEENQYYKPLSQEMEYLIIEIFDFARTNLYTQYSQYNAEQAWRSLKPLFIEQHIAFPDYYDFSTW